MIGCADLYWFMQCNLGILGDCRLKYCSYSNMGFSNFGFHPSKIVYPNGIFIIILKFVTDLPEATLL